MARAAVAERAPSTKAASTQSATRAARPAGKGADLDELSALAKSAKELEDVERAKTGSQNSFITLVQGNSGILLPDDPRYIKGVKLHDYVIASKKLRIGPTLDITVLGMFKLYEERVKKDRDNEMATTVGFWMPDDAMQVPIGKGEIFARPLPNGNILMPVHWVYVYLHDFPDIDDGLIAFRSTGNRVYTALEKLIKAESSVCTELRFTAGKQPIKNDTYGTTNYYPDFILQKERNFVYQDDRAVLVKGGLDKATLKELLVRSNRVKQDYADMKLVSRKNNLPALLGSGPARAAIGANGYEDEAAAEPVTRF
jgi:hypothetical protein